MKPPNPRENVSDAAKRFADIVNALLIAHPWDDIKHAVIAVRLSDGGTDGEIYYPANGRTAKQIAVSHQSDEKLCAYFFFRNCMGGINAIEAQRYLDFNREAYDAGMRMPDPDHKTGGLDLFQSTSDYDLRTGRGDRRLYIPKSIRH